MNPKLQQETNTVLGLVASARNVFGSSAPVEPPGFVMNRRLEDDLGRGYF